MSAAKLREVSPPTEPRDEHPLARLREPFSAGHISKLPKPTKAQTEAVKADFKKGIRCGLSLKATLRHLRMLKARGAVRVDGPDWRCADDAPQVASTNGAQPREDQQ